MNLLELAVGHDPPRSPSPPCERRQGAGENRFHTGNDDFIPFGLVWFGLVWFGFVRLPLMTIKPITNVNNNETKTVTNL
jgi:hypothetical protein